MFRLYNKYVLPMLLDRDMRPAEFNETRKKVVEQAKGAVLEIGFGSGYNLPFYKGLGRFYALDPSVELFSYSRERVSALSFPFEYIQASAELIPLEDASIDTVVSTWSLCSIPDLPKALKEVHRVLKHQGSFLFVEHGQSPKKLTASLQRLLTPITKRFTGNCHLDRKIDDAIKDAGFTIEKIEMFEEEGRPLMYSYLGVAKKE